jgi:hypothetical protein
MQAYVQRTLTYTNDKGTQERINDLELIAVPEPVIVLGEPGLGKTCLLRQLAKQPGWVLRSAASFVAHPNPAALVSAGSKLVIDGLDELSAAQESDPVCRVIGQLIKAGCPPFILSCRAADWRGAVARQDFSDEYGISPREMFLEPFSRDRAIEFLQPMLGEARATEVIDYLEEKAIPDLYGNPLTLSLFGEVAANSRDLPKSRAELLSRSVKLMWNERNDRHDKSSLSTLDQDTALAAAGALSAAFILTGSEAITLKPSNAGAPRTLHAAELRSLPGGEHARTLVGSRLFVASPDTEDQFKPIHRAVAEFLGAKWLAQSIVDDQGRDRALSMMNIDSGVPASLRGIHAWLAHDARFAHEVIAADPYGVLRYGDADGLSVEQGRQLLQALKALQQANPYFRAEDWGSHSAKGLTHIELLKDVREILLADDTTLHLRTLILGVIRGSELAAALSKELQDIMLNAGGASFSFAERHDAAAAAIELEESAVDRKALVERLTQMGDGDSKRLALNVMSDLGFDAFSTDEIARTILAHLGLPGHVDVNADHHRVVDALSVATRNFPDAQVAPMLDAMAMHLRSSVLDGDYDSLSELAGFVMRLIARQVEIAPPKPLTLLRWLRITSESHCNSDNDRERVATFIRQAHELRHEIQHHVIFVERAHERLWRRSAQLYEVNRALELSPNDFIHFLALLAGKIDLTAEDIEIWRELATISQQNNGHAAAIRQAVRPFVSGKAELEAHLDELEKPRPLPEWQVEEAARREERDRKRAEAWSHARHHFAEHEAALRAGEPSLVYEVSRVYLALNSDTDKTLPPADRIGQWLGPELQAAALIGLEAVLTRPDIPSLQQIAEGYAESRRFHIIYALIAGVVQRLREGPGLDDIGIDIAIAVQIALQNSHLNKEIDAPDITKRLEVILRRNPGSYERYIRLLIEPSLERRKTHVAGLYGFGRSSADRELAHRLSIEWLRRYPDLPVGIESELIDVLANSGDLAVLRELQRQRTERGFADDEHRRTWEAVGVLADFDVTAQALGTISEAESSLLWHVRDLIYGGRNRGQPVSSLTAPALAWVVRQFRPLWPKKHPPEGWNGDTNPWDAAEFLELLIKRLATDLSDVAAAELAALAAAPEDSYTDSLRYAADQQRKSRRETKFSGVTLDRLKDVVEARAPRTTDDLLAVVRYAIRRLQKELRGSDTDTITKYWQDNRHPHDEDYCTDRLIEDIQRLLPYGISRIPQRDMPNNKRADIVFTIGDAALPVECKGQWNKALWTAAGDQLDAYYLRDWHSQDRGVYLVYWFGPSVDSNFRLKTPPTGVVRPATAAELLQKLQECVAPARRGSIAIEVLDLTR